MNHKIFCNNCGKNGHNFRDCVEPITSIGIVAYTFIDGVRKYLMIRRRDTLGFVDFMRGKYNVNNKIYLMNIINEMSNHEKELLRTHDFETLWDRLWGKHISLKYLNEKVTSKNKYDILKNGITNNNEKYDLNSILDESTTNWDEQEWGFPKGRRNYKESDMTTGIREFTEETGMRLSDVNIIKNMSPLEEIFTGSNFKSYKHKYYLAQIPNNLSFANFEKSEVSDVQLFTYEECMSKIRSYNLEKRKLITNVKDILDKYRIII